MFSGKTSKNISSFWAPKDELAGKQLCTYNLLQGLVILKMNITLSKIFFYLETICKYASQEKIRIQHNNIFIILMV